METVIHVKLTPKTPLLHSSSPPSPRNSDEPPPSYAMALQLPTHAVPRARPHTSALAGLQRRISGEDRGQENERSGREATVDGTRVWDGEEVESAYDETFEPYDEAPSADTETAATVVSDPIEALTSVSATQPTGVSLASLSRRSSARLVRRSSMPSPPQTDMDDQPQCLQYDAQTYSIVSKLRALNRQLTTKIEQQAKQLQNLTDEKKQHLVKIQTLEADLNMVKQTLKAIQASSLDRSVVRSPEKRLRHTMTTAEADEPPTYESLLVSSTDQELPYVGGNVAAHQSLSSPKSPRSLAASSPPVDVLRPATTATCVAASPRRSPTAPLSPSTASRRLSTRIKPTAPGSPSPHGDKLWAAKVEKLEHDKRNLVHRHAHQLANYSHELSRLERQVENAQKLAQAKDYELRLQKSRHLYACCSSSSGSSATSTGSTGTFDHHHHATLFADALWRELLPSTPPASALLALPFTSHVGLAFEQLLGHQLLAFHDHMVDTTTRDWLHEIRRCGFQMLHLHHAFQCMGQTFQTLAACTHIYDLAESFTREVKQLTRAEQAFLFVVDPAENEFWCRVPRPGETEANPKDMITVRSRVMAVAGTGGVSAVAAEHVGTTKQYAALLGSAAHVPCGLASWVFHTKKPLLIPAGHVTKNPHFSTAPDNTDRLMPFKSASTLLLPVLLGATTLGVIQVCGKLTQVAALGVSISLEKCEAFTGEDQVLLTMLSHFLSGILPKTAYFTEVESNKVNEETLIQLAPEIFTCLRFEELGKIVIQNAKEILDADRCSLFVADNSDRMLFNWQSDISGKGGVEVVTDIKKSTMRVPFGHGIVGMVAETQQLINIPDAYEDPRFNSSWDKKTSYRTKSILTVPILSTIATKSKPPIRRRRSQHDVYGSVIIDKASDTTGGPTPESPPIQTLLGVVQVINKSGGAPFRSKDEFLLQTVSKLIALAIENSQLFQKTQALCASLGKLIARADLAEALATLSACSEDILGVESAAIYVVQAAETTTGAAELLTFHRKRRHKIWIKEHMYRNSLLEQALQTRELVIVNDVAATTPVFNAYVDSIGGLTVRNVLFLPLLIDDPEDATQTAQKLIGVLHLVNTRGRKLAFEPFDLFLSMVGSQTCSVVASILEKQRLLRHQDQTKHLLDTTLGFLKEMSPVGIINAVYNTCGGLFGVEKAHLFLWEPDHRAMWTAKLASSAESAGTSSAALKVLSAASTRDLSSVATPLRNQARRISVLNDQKIRVATSEGLLEHVLSKSAMVVVKQWADAPLTETHRDKGTEETGENSTETVETRPEAVARPPSLDGTKHSLRASRGDTLAGFTKHAVVACPVWDIDAQEIVGVVVLLYDKSKPPSPHELGNLPHLCRQISGALKVCGDLTATTQRCDKLQTIAESFSPRKAAPTVSLTLSARGQLVAFSQPLNVGSSGFSVAALSQFHARSSVSSPSTDLARLPLDEYGHRWVFMLSGASLPSMSSEHFVSWIGKDVPGVGPSSGAFDRLRTDLQSVYVRKEYVRGEFTLPTPAAHPVNNHSSIASLPTAVLLQLRLLLWEFADAQTWEIDVKTACRVFDSVDPNKTRRLSRANVEYALTTHGRRIELDALEWSLLMNAFADATTDLVNVDQMIRSLSPQFHAWPRVAYELIPVLDSLTQSVRSVHVLLTALTDS